MRFLIALLMCCRYHSHVHSVLDGCTDRTKEIIDQVTEQFSHIPITKVYVSDVHEVLSINAGLEIASQDGYGCDIVLQDDVILADFSWESKIAKFMSGWVNSLGLSHFA